MPSFPSYLISNMITFYDIALKDPIKTASPNTWKTRFVLNYKKLPYKTVYLEFSDIESEFIKLGIPPSGAPGQPSYTCPSIIDHSNNTPITDSYVIAEYLDKTYPDTLKVFPPGSEALEAAFYTHFFQVMILIHPFIGPRVPSVLNPRGEEYFVRSRNKLLGIPLADFEPKGGERVQAWKKVQAAFDTLYWWFNQSPGPYFMGETVSFADFVVGGLLYSLELVFGEKSQEWKDILMWNDGGWARFKKNLEPYANTDN